jgi:acyl dehydratase
MTMIGVAQLEERVGQEIGVGDWIEMTQDRIDRFAEATGDRQWIHVDRARAATESPFKATIAHGFLTLSLASVMLRNAITITGITMAINYGLNRVRFTGPVPTGSKVRGRFPCRDRRHWWRHASDMGDRDRTGRRTEARVHG